ncbi:PepSY-associated TM helix domain-containing protein [Sphingobacterium sp.]|uniref:PepSY-associated TM helix domain-containing protein n=1 Tax=Sphingobacterium sp. TaxID=341027 RepID=UPI00289A3E62|nr:PepSY-associated TM helix domain-containing protein [Sphingobacterium sp.]
MKNIWRNIHLYLSLVAGLIFFLECLTGCLLVFEDEITEFVHHDRFYVDQPQAERLPLNRLLPLIEQQLTNREKIANLTVFASGNRTVEVKLQKGQQEKGHKAGKDMNGQEIAGKDNRGEKAPTEKLKGPRNPGGDIVYVDPYTGKLQERVDPQAGTFFKTMLKLHQTLLLNNIGKTILGVSTFIVLVILLSGIILWWPKNINILKNRLKVKTSGSWKRINHDLHVVLGFYCSFFLLVFLVTSLPWSFKWANEALYSMTGSKPPTRERIQLAASDGKLRLNVEEMLQMAKSELPDAPYWRLTLPEGKCSDPVQVTSPNTRVLHRNGFDQIAIDPYVGKIVKIDRHELSPGGWQLRRYMKPVHTGSIGGLPTKILAFVVCLISASFPVTGFVLWMNRTRKGKKKKKMNKLEFIA